MKIFITDGRIVTLKLRGKNIKPKSRSQFQYDIGQQLKKKYPYDQIFEEVFIPIENLWFDFFIPAIQLVVECNGLQHSQHIKFFHKTKQQFNRQQDNDQKKREICKLNNFKLIEVYYE